MTSDQADDLADKILKTLSESGIGYYNLQDLGENGFDVVHVATSLKEKGLIDDFQDPHGDRDYFRYRILEEGRDIVDREGGYKKWKADDRKQKQQERKLLTQNLRWVRPLAFAALFTALATIGLLIIEIMKAWQAPAGCP